MLTEQQFKDAAQLIGCEAAAVKSVTEVESRGSGFRSDGKAKILFEGHIFWKQLLAVNIDPLKIVKGNEDILYPTWIPAMVRPLYAMDQYQRLGKAKLIHEEAALKSASWGAFQIMGFNYKTCGYDNVEAYVAAQTDEYNQLKSFCNYIINNHLSVHLINKDWAGFARAYNGPDYTKNQYDKKLKSAYDKFLVTL